MGGKILKTINGGINWSTLNSGTTNDLYEIHFTYDIVGYTVGENGIILNTTNGGANWVSLASGTTNTLRSVYFPAVNIGYTVGENGTIRKTVTGFVGAEESNINSPKEFSLHQNYPNPFNPATKIKFDISANGKGQIADVKLIIYSIQGKEIAVLVNRQMQPGTYEIEWNAINYSSGVYYYKLTAGSYSETKKLVLLK